MYWSIVLCPPWTCELLVISMNMDPIKLNYSTYSTVYNKSKLDITLWLTVHHTWNLSRLERIWVAENKVFNEKSLCQFIFWLLYWKHWLMLCFMYRTTTMTPVYPLMIGRNVWRTTTCYWRPWGHVSPISRSVRVIHWPCYFFFY